MQKQLFSIQLKSEKGHKIEEVVSLPDNIPEDQIDNMFQEWMWKHINAYRMEVTPEMRECKDQ